MSGRSVTAGRRTLAAWVGYDMALHGYALMIPAVGYALYFTSFVASGEARASLLWSIAVAIPLAFALRSYWALVGGIVAGNIAAVVVSYALLPYRPRFCLKSWRPLFGFSKWIQVSSMLRYVRDRGFVLVMGRVLDAGAIGLFSMAKEIGGAANQALIAPINRAVFPGYSRLSHDAERLRHAGVRRRASRAHPHRGRSPRDPPQLRSSQARGAPYELCRTFPAGSQTSTATGMPSRMDAVTTQKSSNRSRQRLSRAACASVAGAGDVNGDGYADMLIGSGYMEHGETNEGMAFLWFGSAAGLRSTGGYSGADRSQFDDVDDYNNYTASPPKLRDGTVLTSLTGYKQKVSVSLDGASIYKKISVNITKNDRDLVKIVMARGAHDADQP